MIPGTSDIIFPKSIGCFFMYPSGKELRESFFREIEANMTCGKPLHATVITVTERLTKTVGT